MKINIFFLFPFFQPRIDPQQLLNCLSVLLASNGGIKSSNEVNRLVQLMGKFSKKLVSKCIYVQILKSTETDLLGQFMADGGWALSYVWLQDGILSRNWPLVQELLELMLLCPVDVQRLKSNSAPKLVKGLTKEGGNEGKNLNSVEAEHFSSNFHHIPFTGVRILASKLVEQWLKIVKGESLVTPVTVQQQNVVVAEVPEVKEKSAESGDDEALDEEADETEDMVDPLEIPSNHVPQDDVDSKERISKAKSDGLVYKITVKDGKQVFAKLETSPKKEADGEKLKIKQELSTKTKSDDPIAKLKIATVDGKKQIKDKIKAEIVETKDQDKVEANKKLEKVKSESGKERTKSDDKERRSSKESAKESSDSKEKRKESSSKSSSSSSSKHSSGSSSRSSSHKSSRSNSDSKHKTSSSSSSSSSRDKSRDSEKDKDRERSSKSSSSKSSSKSSSSSSSSSSKSSQSKEKRDSTDEKLSQSAKDKDTLTKVIPPSISKLGKIPKKPASEGESADPAPLKKSSISIEVKKDAENRPKTVKTFNSKFRSHGLAEEAPPPPSRRGLQRPSSQPTVGASIPGTTVTKRPSPPPEKKEPVVPEKKLKIDTSLAVEKPGIKLIPAKPKSEYLSSNSFNHLFCPLISDVGNCWHMNYELLLLLLLSLDPVEARGVCVSIVKLLQKRDSFTAGENKRKTFSPKSCAAIKQLSKGQSFVGHTSFCALTRNSDQSYRIN